ncbi:MAG: hypothetical protein PVI54_18800, partial [Desulfobacteraceae bacterium]
MEKTVRKFLNMNFKKNTSKKIPTGRKQIYSAGSKAVSERRWQFLTFLHHFHYFPHFLGHFFVFAQCRCHSNEHTPDTP